MQKPSVDIEKKISRYPLNVQKCFLQIRALIFAVCEEYSLGEIEETLKWGEPAYLVKGGSTLRMNWRANTPANFYLFFNCNSRLVETFKEIYFDVFEFEGNRAIRLDVTNKLPMDELSGCVLMTLQYHKLKKQPLLGA